MKIKQIKRNRKVGTAITKEVFDLLTLESAYEGISLCKHVSIILARHVGVEH